MNNNRVAQALVKSVGADGTHWLLVLRPDDGWEIMRDLKRVAVGRSDPTSINSGVRRFLSLTVAAVPHPGAATQARTEELMSLQA